MQASQPIRNQQSLGQAERFKQVLAQTIEDKKLIRLREALQARLGPPDFVSRKAFNLRDMT